MHESQRFHHFVPRSQTLRAISVSFNPPKASQRRVGSQLCANGLAVTRHSSHPNVSTDRGLTSKNKSWLTENIINWHEGVNHFNEENNKQKVESHACCLRSRALTFQHEMPWHSVTHVNAIWKSFKETKGNDASCRVASSQLKCTTLTKLAPCPFLHAFCAHLFCLS